MKILPSKELDAEATAVINELDHLMSVVKEGVELDADKWVEWQDRYFKARDRLHKWQQALNKHITSGGASAKKTKFIAHKSDGQF